MGRRKMPAMAEGNRAPFETRLSALLRDAGDGAWARGDAGDGAWAGRAAA